MAERARARARSSYLEIAKALDAGDTERAACLLQQKVVGKNDPYSLRQHTLLRALLTVLTATNVFEYRRAWREYAALLLRSAWLGYHLLEQDGKESFTVEKADLLAAYLWLDILLQREAGELPAYEALRLVRVQQG